MTGVIPDLTFCKAGDPDAIPADWLAERKFDGIRVVASAGTLRTRSGRDITPKVPEIDIPEDTIDGELVPAPDEGTLADVQRRVQVEGEFKIEVLSQRSPLQLLAFDILTHGTEDLRDRPLVDRNAHLLDAIQPYDGVFAVEPHRDPGWLWDEANAQGWEGIVVKDPEAPYPGERSGRWLKFKTWSEVTAPIIAHEWTDDDGFVIFADIGTDEPQKVPVNGHDDREAIEAGAEAAVVQFLERTDNDRLRKPSFKRVA